VLDTAAISTRSSPSPTTPRDLLIRSGFLCLRRIADYFGIGYDPDPRPDDPISVTRREFNLLCVELEAAGVPLKPDRDQAWQDFAGWRVNYDTVLLALCVLVMAPPAIWSSDRVKDGRMRMKVRRRSRAPLVAVARPHAVAALDLARLRLARATIRARRRWRRSARRWAQSLLAIGWRPRERDDDAGHAEQNGTTMSHSGAGPRWGASTPAPQEARPGRRCGRRSRCPGWRRSAPG
jgi:hypothetical protein